MTKPKLLAKARELSAEFSKREDWKPGLSDFEKECWYTLIALIDYVEEHETHRPF